MFSNGGRNSDFGMTWYEDIETQLAVTLVLLSLMPICMVLFELVHLRIMQYL